jgi:hypothetical protein
MVSQTLVATTLLGFVLAIALCILHEGFSWTIDDCFIDRLLRFVLATEDVARVDCALSVDGSLHRIVKDCLAHCFDKVIVVRDTSNLISVVLQ